MRKLPPGASGIEDDGGSWTKPRPAHASRGRVTLWPAVRVAELYEAYVRDGALAAAEGAGLSEPHMYRLFRRDGHELVGRRARAPQEATVPPPPHRVPEAAPAPAGSTGAKDGIQRPPLVHRGAVAPGTQIGHIELPCPKCGHLLEQTIVLRDAGAGR